MLHPIVVRPDGKLIAGERRLRAAQMLGWKKIAVTVIDLTAVVRGEFAENAHRKDFTLSEAVAIKRALEPLERAAAKQRQGRRTDKHPEKFSGSSKGRALDKVAAVAGMHRTTIAKAEAVVDAAAAEPERFANLLADMDRTGKVNGPFKRLGVLKQAAAIRAEPPPARAPPVSSASPGQTRSVRNDPSVARPMTILQGGWRSGGPLRRPTNVSTGHRDPGHCLV